jgi:hypothetical protein
MEGRFTKSMLRVGTYHSPDGEVVVTPERLRHWEKQVKKIQSVGYAIPTHFDHSNDMDLLTPIHERELTKRHSRSAMNTVGKLQDFKVAADGRSAEIVIHTMTPEATSLAEKNAVYISPVIHPNWKDGAGNSYADALTSFDLVDYPVDFSQSSFSPVKMGLGVVPVIRMGTSKPYFWERSMPVSNKPKLRSAAARKARKAFMRRAVAAGLARMGSDYIDDEDDDEMPGMDAASDAMGDPSEVTPTPSDDESPTETMGADADSAPDLLDSVLNLLNEFGVALPDDTTDKNLISHLRVALTALLNAEKDDDDDEEDDMEGDDELLGDPMAMPAPVAPTIATLSLGQRKALDRATALEAKFRAQHKQQTEQRLAALVKSGRCTPHEHDQMLAKLGTVRMSLKDDGSFEENRVDAFIEDRSTVPEGTYWTSKQRTQSVSKLSVVEAPDGITTGGGRSHNEFADSVRALGGHV